MLDRPKPRVDDPILGAETDRSFPAIDFDVRAGPSASLPPTRGITDAVLERADGGRRLPAERRPGRPRVELRVPTGWSKSVTAGDLKRRKAQTTPQPPDSAAGSATTRSRLSTAQFLVVSGLIALLNAPVLMVGWDYLDDRIGHTVETTADELSVEDLVAIELALEADPAGGEAILAAYDLDRHRWSDLRAQVTTDPALNARFEAIRERRRTP